MKQIVDIYERCLVINDILNANDKENARAEVIKLLNDINGDKDKYTPLLNHLIREVGLYPYLNPATSDWCDRFVYEAFQVDVGEEKECTLHIEQSNVLKKLLAGDNIAVSAPTSFGKSFIVDAFIAIKKPSIIVLIVPTVALADESRRRLQRKFSSQYKIVTTTDSSIEEKTIFIFPQERVFAYIDTIKDIDILIIDEFYKASSQFDDNRSCTLLNAMIELGKKAHQRYYLAPNIDQLSENVFTEGMIFMRLDFKTVVTTARQLYNLKKANENKNTFKKRMLHELFRDEIGKTLVYAGTYSNITTVCNELKAILQEKNTKLLNDFCDWLSYNYGKDYSLNSLVKLGVGIHNGQLHRSLSQIQIKLFEYKLGLDTIVSTSSIIEGVNTQAESVVLWSTQNGSKSIDYFTYRNIVGRAGRMLKYFIGKVYMLESPPKQNDTKLDFEFPDDVATGLDEENPGVKLNNDQFLLIKKYHDEMIELVGFDTWEQLKQEPQIKAASPSFIKTLVISIINNRNWPRNYSALNKCNTWNWRPALEDVLDIAEIGNKNKVRAYACMACHAWNSTIPQLHEQVSQYGIDYEDMFAFERTISFNLASVLSLINIIKLNIYPGSPDISYFVHRVSNAFLPKLVYQLEEYGLPRMISKKIQITKLINLEDDSKEISTVVDEFKQIGKKRLLESIHNLHPFDTFIINYFFEGIE